MKRGAQPRSMAAIRQASEGLISLLFRQFHRAGSADFTEKEADGKTYWHKICYLISVVPNEMTRSPL
jgi:hypothetical protein